MVTAYRDDLPALSISRLRATGVITAETTTFRIKLGHVEQNVSIHLRRFPSGGSWSWFGCPMCCKWARTLRLHLDDIVCPGCCKRRGIRHRRETMSVRQRAEHRIPQLKAMLESKESLRLKPHLWGKMERRSRLEAALKRAEFVLKYGRPRRGPPKRGFAKLASETPDPADYDAVYPEGSSRSRSPR